MGDRSTAGSSANEGHLGEGWRKSSHSMSNGQCLEAARLPGGRIGVRDSKTPEGPVLRFDREAWSALLTKLRTSELHKS
jgi:Domain of unknown function (DUF397)